MERKSNPLQIIPGVESEKVLNKEQKRFNSLVKKISLTRERIQEVKVLDMELRRLGDELLNPQLQKVNAALRDWVFTLHHHPGRHKLSKKLAERFTLVMMEEIISLLEAPGMQEDEALEELYCFYEGSGRSFLEIQADAAMEEKLFTADMMNAFFDADFEAEDFDNPEIMQEKMSAAEAAFEAKHQPQENHQKNRKKSDAARAAEEKRKAIEASVKKTAKQIYIDLVQNFHPDKEPDEQKRAEKNDIMQQITAAYQADDHLRLLELQMNLLSSRDNVFADFDNAQLKYFNQTLKRQLDELEAEFYFSSPGGNNNPYGHLYHPNAAIMLINVERAEKQLKETVKGVRKNLSLVGDEKMFKQYIQDFDLDW